MKSIYTRKSFALCILLIVISAANLTILQGQIRKNNSIAGDIRDEVSKEGVAFATIALRKTSDSTLITGTSGDIDGGFIISSVPDGSYTLIISAIGYINTLRNIELSGDINIGLILLKEQNLALSEIVVSGERVKAKAEAGKTTYFINEKIYSASNSGADMLRYIPGIQVDLMKNISLSGSQNVVIMVDGKERDRNYLSQLNPELIDKIEVTNTPDTRFDGNITGVINVILRKDINAGLNSNIYLEIPASGSEIYVSPDYSFNYNSGKFNIYTSYNGNLSYFNINESNYRKTGDEQGITEIKSTQDIRQKYWSHRFHFGLDYSLNPKNQFNFYAFYNPYSGEHDGSVELTVTGDMAEDNSWSAIKEDTDMNNSLFFSLFYKHLFEKQGREISFDLNYSGFRADNTTAYTMTSESQSNLLNSIINSVSPLQTTLNFKADFTSPLAEKIKLDAGLKSRIQLSKDRLSEEFRYSEDVLSLYGTLTYSGTKHTISTGIRAEESLSGASGSIRREELSLLPAALISFRMTPKQNIKLTFNRTVNRPNLYELNPYVSVDDPFAISSGNAGLKQEQKQILSVDYSASIGNNFISTQLFFKKRIDAINRYTFINDVNIFETRTGNLGEIFENGIQISGALKPLKSVALNPYFRFFSICTEVNELARQYGIDNSSNLAFESGLTAIVTFRHDITGSIQFQYNSPVSLFQGKSFSDALYFVSLEKAFKKGIKVGIKSALPFAGSFTYQGFEIDSKDFISRSEGNINLSAFPLWLTFRYHFTSGKAAGNSVRVSEDIQTMPKKGF